LEKIKCDIAVNIQGDEPLITGELIDQAVENSINDEKIDIATLACPIKNEAELNDPSSVKVVCDVKGFALYFSRSVIPYSGHSSLVTRHSDMNTALWWKHIGLYAYRSEVVKQVTAMRPTALELTEKLEQLRWLEIGYKIKVIKVIGGLIGVDTKEDLERVRELFKAKGKKLETKGKS
jgi:3-deoxy-manno-octulosonate cytidylyltransferase (CMP-KDO synthetase)